MEEGAQPKTQGSLPAFEARLIPVGVLGFLVVALASTALFFLSARPPSWPWFTVLLPALVIAHVGVLGWRRGPPRARSAIFLATAFVWAFSVGAQFGWGPAYVLILVFLVTLGGLLLGPRATYVLVLVHLVGLLLVGQGFTGAPLPQGFMDPERLSNWVRVAAVYLIVTGAMLTVLARALAWLERARADAQDNLRRSEIEADASVGAQRARLEVERGLRRSQRLRTLHRLASGLGVLYGRALTVVRAGLEELAEAEGPEAVRAACAVVEAGARRAVQPTRELLVFGRPSSVSRESLDVGEQVRALEPRLRAALAEGARLEVEATTTAPAFLEATRLAEVLAELLLNARDASSGPGHVRVVVDEVLVDAPVPGLDLAPGRYARVRVEDRGAGMTPEVLARATEPFFTTKPERQGHAGLGLAVALGFAKQAGGTLRIGSAPGVGTTVELYLYTRGGDPQVALPRPEPSSAEAPPEPQAATPSGREEPWQPGPWREDAVRILARWLTVLLALALAMSFVATPVEVLTVAAPPVAGGLVVMLLVWRLEGMGYWARAFAIVAVLAVLGVGMVVTYSFLAPATLALVPMVVALALLLLPPPAAWVALVLTCASFLVAGWLHAFRIVDPPLHAFLPSRPENWVRLPILLSLALLLFGRVIQSVFERARAEVERLEASVASLAAARAAREAEVADLVLAERMKARAASLEVTGKLTGAIAHDMNNVLQVLLGWSSTLATDPGDRGLCAQALDSLQTAADDAEALVRILQPDVVLDEPAPRTELQRSVRRVAKLMQAVLPSGVEIVVDVAPGLYAPVSELELRRLLLNLANNAGQAMPEGGRLTLRGARDGDEVRLEVQDTGVGMSEEVRAQVFEAFFTTKAEGQGTGLGLSSVRQIMSARGGRVDVKSAPGAGATFTLWWPADLADGPWPVAADAEARSPGATVLVSDVDPEVLRMMQRALTRAGCQVRVAQDGPTLRAALQAGGPPDGVCVDARVAGEVSEALLQLLARSPASTIFVCGEAVEALAGDAVVVPKPFSGARLAREVASRLCPPGAS